MALTNKKPSHYFVAQNKPTITGEITLDGSKSISNRVLVIRALCGKSFPIQHLSSSDDTRAMQAALTNSKSSGEAVIDVGAAGTTMRFLTAYYATHADKTTVLTGSQRMKQRPIEVLVNALRTLGADIAYLESEGCPPLRINGKKLAGGSLSMNAGVSSQYISALLMIAPSLNNGLSITLIGDLVSRPYLEMTLNIMQQFGVSHTWQGNTISITPQTYQAKPYTVEADWSAASYYYAVAAFSQTTHLQLNGLQGRALQGDSVLIELMQQLGVQSTLNKNGVLLTKIANAPLSKALNFNFLTCPDIAQTLAVVCAGLQVPAQFSGLITLSIKETDRTAALQTELKKIGVDFIGQGDEWTLHLADKQVLKQHIQSTSLQISTYHDHRMAMAFAPVAMVMQQAICIEDPMVVTKSYPKFWQDFATLGFDVST